MKKFNQNEYINDYKKEHYSQFKVDLKKEEKKELDELLNTVNLTKKDFLLNSVSKLKEEIKMKKYYVHSGTFNCEKRGNWIYNGDVFNGNDNNEIFDDVFEAREFYDSIELKDIVNGNNRYSDYKELYEIDSNIDSIDDIDLDKAKLIIDECTFVDYM